MSFHLAFGAQEEPQEAPKGFPFDTTICLSDLIDSDTVTYVTRYSVTGQTIKVRQNREPISRQVLVNGRQILLWRHGREVFATSTICPHQGLSLALGDLEDLNLDGKPPCITCPHHKWKWDVQSGSCRNHMDPDRMLTTYNVQLDSNERIYIVFPSFDQSLFSQDSQEDF